MFGAEAYARLMDLRDEDGVVIEQKEKRGRMATSNLEEVKQFVLSYKQTENEAILDSLESAGKYDRAVIMSAMKALQNDGRGRFVVGRKGGKTRFEFGAQVEEKPSAPPAQESKINIIANGLENVIKQEQEKNPNNPLIFNVDELAARVDRSLLIAAFRVLETRQIGTFIVGRKEQSSRFVVGEVKKEKPVVDVIRSSDPSRYDLPVPEVGPFSESGVSVPGREDKELSVSGAMIRLTPEAVVLLVNMPGGKDSVEDAVAVVPQLSSLPEDKKSLLIEGLKRHAFVYTQFLGVELE